MAINHNFKEGIDWAADSTGETPLAGYVFVSKSGDDGTGDGSPQNPYNTISAAFAAGGVSDTFVVGAGLYTESGLSSPSSSTLILCDGYVILKGNGSNTLMSTACIIENAIIENWQQVFNIRTGQYRKCLVVNSDYIVGGATGTATWQETIFVNSINEQDWSGTITIDKCIFINSSFTRGGSTSSTVVKSTFVDEASTIENDPSSGSITFSALNGNVIGFLTRSNNIESINPAFNNKSGFDLSVTSSSELIASGENGSNIGNVFIAKGYYQGVSELDNGIDANSNIAYNSLGEIELQGGAAAAEVFETDEEEALELSVLGSVNISGFLDLINNTPDTDNTLTNPNQLILEINVAELDGIFKGYKKYKWNEQPTQNADGTPNGDSSYDYSDNNKVRWKKRKFRITVRSDYNQA